MRAIATIALVAACGPAPSRAPAAEPKPATPARYAEETPRESADCSALHQAWQREWGDDAEARRELEERIAAFPCELALDLDGDGQNDRALIVSNDGQVGIAVVYASGDRAVLGAGTAVDVRPGADGYQVRRDATYDWIVGWAPVWGRDEGFDYKVLGQPQRFAAPGAIGDGIKISGGDAAAIFYRDATGWRWIHLGF